MGLRSQSARDRLELPSSLQTIFMDVWRERAPALDPIGRRIVQPHQHDLGLSDKRPGGTAGWKRRRREIERTAAVQHLRCIAPQNLDADIAVPDIDEDVEG